jgi:hypothetical protein
MPTYEVLVSDALLPDFANDSSRLPSGFRVLGPADGPSGYRSTRLRVEDDSAPSWTEGKLITPTFTTEYKTNTDGYPTGEIARVVITDWREEDQEAVRIAGAVQRAEDNPGTTATADGAA